MKAQAAPPTGQAKRAKWIRVRIGILTALLLVFAGALLRRAYALQIVESRVLGEMASEQYLRNIRLAPKRGTIYDRNGFELAVSVDVDSVWANPREARRLGADPVALAHTLAGLVAVEESTLATRLSSDRHFVWIARRVTPAAAARIRALRLPGVSISREARRYYPNRELAAHVLGFADVDGVGVEGIEHTLEERLRGSVSAVQAIRDRTGAIVFSDQLLDEGATRGEDVVLTIDRTIQTVAQREIELAVRTFEAHAGSVVVIDPRTGEILALANYPTFNPNDPGNAEAAARRNRAVTDRFEPGSSVKPFTIGTALATGAIAAEAPIDCEHGAMRIAEYTIHDTHPWDLLTPSQILARSSNIGTAKVGQALGRARLYRGLRSFGFGEETGIILPGETGGILRHYRRWYEMDAATISFGQGFSATTLQLAMAIGTIANGGELMEPMLVRRFRRGDRVLEDLHPQVRHRAIPQPTARLVADMLTAVTGPLGTGAEASIDGYVVAGKTGTAQKADYVVGGYAADRWTASFVGFVPANAPRIAIAVVVDEPMIDHYGGVVAAPVFRRVAAAALQHVGVPARGSAGRFARSTPVATVNPPNVSPPTAQASARAAEVAAISLAHTGGEVTVPSLVGLPARRAVRALAAAHLVPEFAGSGRVAQQTPAAGSVVASGTTVSLVLGLSEPAPNVESERE